MLAVLLLAPLTSGSAPFTVVHITKVTAPYVGVVVQTTSGSASENCAKTTMPSGPSFTSATGVGAFSLRATARSCSVPVTYGLFGYASLEVRMRLPTLAGQSRVTATWNVAISGATSIALGSCRAIPGHRGPSSCVESDEVQFEVSGYVQDLSSGGSWGGPNVFYFSLDLGHEVDCLHGNCSTFGWGSAGPFAIVSSFALHIPTPGFLRGHSYELVLAVFGMVGSAVTVSGMTLTGARASASLDLTSAGSATALSNIVVR